jgi:hypothetical protein
LGWILLPITKKKPSMKTRSCLLYQPSDMDPELENGIVEELGNEKQECFLVP